MVGGRPGGAVTIPGKGPKASGSGTEQLQLSYPRGVK